jgi:hypothetical protein
MLQKRLLLKNSDINYLFYWHTKNGNKILYNIIGIFFSNKVETKVQRGFRFWTFLKMSIFEKCQDFVKKAHQKVTCDENAHNFDFSSKKV